MRVLAQSGLGFAGLDADPDGGRRHDANRAPDLNLSRGCRLLQNRRA